MSFCTARSNFMFNNNDDLSGLRVVRAGVLNQQSVLANICSYAGRHNRKDRQTAASTVCASDMLTLMCDLDPEWRFLIFRGALVTCRLRTLSF